MGNYLILLKKIFEKWTNTDGELGLSRRKHEFDSRRGHQQSFWLGSYQTA
jgi:hypothetical protein